MREADGCFEVERCATAAVNLWARRRFLMVGASPPIICRRDADVMLVCLIIVQNISRHFSPTIRASVRIAEFPFKNVFLKSPKVQKVKIFDLLVLTFKVLNLSEYL